MADASSLFSTVRNPTAGSRTYGYLGYHGKTLPSAAEYTWFGSMIDYAAAGKPTHKRWTDAIQRDLSAGTLQIIRTPRPIMQDNTTLAIKALALNGGALGTIDPSWGASVG